MALKHIFLCLPLFLGACTNDDVLLEEQLDKQIEFDCSLSFARSVVNDASDLIANGGAFNVWAHRTSGNGIVKNVFLSERVYHDGTHWTYDDERVWIMYNSYNFYALYPAATYDVIYNNNTFTINNYNANAQEDFLLAKKEDHQFPDDGATVHLSFEHLLSHISIKLKKADDEEGKITVTGIDLANLNVIANYSTSNGDYGGWNNWTRKTDTSFNLGNDGVTLTDNLQICGEGIFVIPQEISDEMKFYIYYTYTPNGAQEAQSMTPLEIDIPNTVSITTEGGTKELSYWPNGIKIAYSGTVSLGKIEFSTPKVEEWGQKQSSGTIIIK